MDTRDVPRQTWMKGCGRMRSATLDSGSRSLWRSLETSTCKREQCSRASDAALHRARLPAAGCLKCRHEMWWRLLECPRAEFCRRLTHPASTNGNLSRNGQPRHSTQRDQAFDFRRAGRSVFGPRVGEHRAVVRTESGKPDHCLSPLTKIWMQSCPFQNCLAKTWSCELVQNSKHSLFRSVALHSGDREVVLISSHQNDVILPVLKVFCKNLVLRTRSKQ